MGTNGLIVPTAWWLQSWD